MNNYVANSTSLLKTNANQTEQCGELLQQARDKEATEAIITAVKNLSNGNLEKIVPELLNKLSNYSGGTERESFKLSRLDSIEIKPTLWIVDKFIEVDSFCSLYGDSGVGKSFLAIELAACIATGTPFFGMRVKQGVVIYLAGEGHSGIRKRFEAWSIMRGVSLKDVPLYLSTGVISLIEPVTMVSVCRELTRVISETGNPSFVVFDTWSRVLSGDDSSPSDAQEGVKTLDSLRARFGNFSAVVVHHTGHSAKERASVL